MAKSSLSVHHTKQSLSEVWLELAIYGLGGGSCTIRALSDSRPELKSSDAMRLVLTNIIETDLEFQLNRTNAKAFGGTN